MPAGRAAQRAPPHANLRVDKEGRRLELLHHDTDHASDGNLRPSLALNLTNREPF